MAGVLGEPPFILGWDVAGVVEQVGYGVTTLAPGDEVYGMPWFPRAAGAYGDYVTAPARQFARRPVELSAVQAAALPLAVLTAWQALVDTADVAPGQRVLVTAAAGGVGHLAVQIARHLGAHAIGVASGRHRDWVTALGAKEFVDYTQGPFEQAVGDVDIVLDLVGDDHDTTGTRTVSTLRPGGLLVAVPGLSDSQIQASADRGTRVTPFLVEPDGAALARVAGLVAAGELQVEVAQVFELEAAAQAHALGETGRTRGKIVLDVAAGLS